MLTFNSYQLSSADKYISKINLANSSEMTSSMLSWCINNNSIHQKLAFIWVIYAGRWGCQWYSGLGWWICCSGQESRNFWCVSPFIGSLPWCRRTFTLKSWLWSLSCNTCQNIVKCFKAETESNQILCICFQVQKTQWLWVILQGHDRRLAREHVWHLQAVSCPY